MLDKIHCRMVDLVCEPATKLALKARNVDAGLAKAKGMNFKKLVYFPEDKATGEPDLNKNPTQYFKLNTYEQYKTKFTILNKDRQLEIIEWKLIQQAEFGGFPLIKYSHIYSGAQVSTQ